MVVMGMAGMRDALCSALRLRLQRITAVDDPSLALEPGALAEAKGLADRLVDDDGDLEARYLLGWIYLHRFLALPPGRGDSELAVAADMFGTCFMFGVPDLPPVLLPASRRTGLRFCACGSARGVEDA